MLKIYSNGLTLGIPPNKPNMTPSKRDKVKGWSKSSTRSNTQFLYSVDTKKLDGNGIAFTFTVRDLPPTPKDWKRIRDAFFKRMKRWKGDSFLRYHWVTEWQRRGVPHLHGCMYFSSPIQLSDFRTISSHWCKAAALHSYAIHKGQQVLAIDGALGWLKYLAKHNSRSASHYQRTSKPSEWDSSGRVWGKGGLWAQNLTEHDIGAYFHKFRRIVRSWRKSDARASGDFHRVKSARRCLTCNDRSLSQVRGMSEWIPQELTFQIVSFFESQG